MELCVARLLMLTIIQGEIFFICSFPSNENVIKAELPKSDDEQLPNITVRAFLPAHDPDNLFIRKRRSPTGRVVNIPGYDASMANIPFSSLSTDHLEIQQEIINIHNELRCTANPPASNMLMMVWSPEAQKNAEAWANTCPSGHSVQDQRLIPNLKCGESLLLTSILLPWTHVVKAWYSELTDFLYGKGATSNVEIGHFTQVMWAPTWKCGCGIAQCPNSPNRYVYVCHYGPSGNKGSLAKPWIEGKPCGACPQACENNLCTNPCHYQNYFRDCENYKSTCTSNPSMKDNCPAACECTKGEIK